METSKCIDFLHSLKNQQKSRVYEKHRIMDEKIDKIAKHRNDLKDFFSLNNQLRIQRLVSGKAPVGRPFSGHSLDMA